jgi:hypothetical protein
MYISINNKKNSKVFKIASAFYLGFASERVTRRFPTTNISAGNRTQFRGKHVAHELRVELPVLKSDV